MRTWRQKFGLLILLCGTQVCIISNMSRAAEIKVTLFGQPCVLKGPIDSVALKSIHLISPEQLLAAQDSVTESKQHSLSVLNRLLKSAPVPNVLDRYKERLKKRLEAQVDFFDSLDEFKQTGKAETLSALVKRRVLPKSQKEFEAILRKTPTKDLFDPFNEVIEPDPEEDFHRGIQKIKVQYVCAFDEGSINKGNGESE